MKKRKETPNFLYRTYIGIYYSVITYRRVRKGNLICLYAKLLKIGISPEKAPIVPNNGMAKKYRANVVFQAENVASEKAI